MKALILGLIATTFFTCHARLCHRYSIAFGSTHAATVIVLQNAAFFIGRGVVILGVAIIVKALILGQIATTFFTRHARLCHRYSIAFGSTHAATVIVLQNAAFFIASIIKALILGQIATTFFTCHARLCHRYSIAFGSTHAATVIVLQNAAFFIGRGFCFEVAIIIKALILGQIATTFFTCHARLCHRYSIAFGSTHAATVIVLQNAGRL